MTKFNHSVRYRKFLQHGILIIIGEILRSTDCADFAKSLFNRAPTTNSTLFAAPRMPKLTIYCQVVENKPELAQFLPCLPFVAPRPAQI